MFEQQCIFHLVDGLHEGLSHFSGLSRVALVYAAGPWDEFRVYDPQNLLEGHEPRLREYFVDTPEWRGFEPMNLDSRPLWQDENEGLQLSGLLSEGAWSPSVYYQRWFTEHHQDMCSAGPTLKWLEYACWVLSRTFSVENVLDLDVAGQGLQERSLHAVRDYIVDERGDSMGMDTHLRVYPVLDAVLGVSKTLEEGARAQGKLAFVEPAFLDQLTYLARFPKMEQPSLGAYKHVRKLLQAVENTDRFLVSEGRHIVGIAVGAAPRSSVTAEFLGRYGYLRLDNDLVCSFRDGGYHSSTGRANLVQLEEIFLEHMEDKLQASDLYRAVAALTHHAQNMGHGCTLVVDYKGQGLSLAGQHLEEPLDLRYKSRIELAQSLSCMDGALHIGADLELLGFGCLLDGSSVPGEDRARGARYNSALRYSAKQRGVAVVVVSSDRPVSIFQDGVELTAKCFWKQLMVCAQTPPTLREWVR